MARRGGADVAEVGDGSSKKECAYAMNMVHGRRKKEMCKAKRNVQKTFGNLRNAVAGYNQPNVEGPTKTHEG